MKSFRSILVDIDATASAHPALERAVLLAKRSGAKLTVADAMMIPDYAHGYLPAGVEESIVRDPVSDSHGSQDRQVTFMRSQTSSLDDPQQR